MSSEPEVKTQADALAWIHWCRGRRSIEWREQDRVNTESREDIRLLDVRLQALETKVAVWAAMAALLGAMVGALGVQLFRWYLSMQGSGP